MILNNLLYYLQALFIGSWLSDDLVSKETKLVAPGEFPFIVGIISPIDHTESCAGAILTSRLILVDAKCICRGRMRDNQPQWVDAELIPLNELSAVAGKTKFDPKQKQNAIEFVQAVGDTCSKYIHFVLLATKSPIEFNDLISPYNLDSANNTNPRGLIVKWEPEEDGSRTLRKASVRIVDPFDAISVRPMPRDAKNAVYTRGHKYCKELVVGGYVFSESKTILGLSDVQGAPDPMMDLINPKVKTFRGFRDEPLPDLIRYRCRKESRARYSKEIRHCDELFV